jgi:hypothetical protein
MSLKDFFEKVLSQHNPLRQHSLRQKSAHRKWMGTFFLAPKHDFVNGGSVGVIADARN